MGNKLKSNRSWEKEILNEVEELERRTYDHTDNAEEMTDKIMNLVQVSGVDDEEVKRAIANEAVELLAMFRFE